MAKNESWADWVARRKVFKCAVCHNQVLRERRPKTCVFCGAKDSLELVPEEEKKEV